MNEGQLLPHGERGTLVCTHGGKRGSTAPAAERLLMRGEMGGVCVPVPLILVFKRRSSVLLCNLCPLEGSSKAPWNFLRGKLKA